jgi:uncharacterized protein YndB with AHSA1/START domain
MTRQTTAEFSIEIDRPVEEVFAFVADARNDPLWCPRVLASEQTSGDGPGPDARYRERHNPTFMRHKTRQIAVLEFSANRFIRWRQEDENGVFRIEYWLQPTPSGTRFTQTDVIDWKISPFAVQFGRRIVPRHIRQQFRRLKRLLEGGTVTTARTHSGRIPQQSGRGTS